MDPFFGGAPLGAGAPYLPRNKKGLVPPQYAMGPWAAGPPKMTRAEKKAYKNASKGYGYGYPAGYPAGYGYAAPCAAPLAAPYGACF